MTNDTSAADDILGDFFSTVDDLTYSSRPLVSVIIPIFKVGPYVRKCLQSLIDQSYPNIETILVNDATPDDSMVIARRLASELQDLKCIDLTENGGLSNARNVGMRAATGKYIFFLDSDDWLAPNAIQLAVEKAEAGDLEVAIIDYYRANIQGKLVRAKDRNPYKDANLAVFDPAERQSALQIFNLAQIKLYRRDFLETNDFQFTTGVIYEDIDWTFKILTTATRVGVIDKPLYYYRTARPGSILNTPGLKHFDVLYQYERVFQHLAAHDKDIFFQTIYNYGINSIYSVLVENDRIPLAERENFFLEAKRIFSEARGSRTFPVTLYGRAWFETILMNTSYADLVKERQRRVKAFAKSKGRIRIAFKASVPYAFGLWCKEVWKAPRSTFKQTLPYAVGVEALSKVRRVARAPLALVQTTKRFLMAKAAQQPLRQAVFFESYWGNQFADSPKYTYEYLRKNHPDVRCFFALRPEVKADIPLADRIKWGSLRYFYTLATSAVVINNNNFHALFKKRPEARFIQTFHGIPLKYIGTDMAGYADGKGTNFSALVDRCSMWDYVITAGAHHSEALRGAFHSRAQFLEIGSPRTDCLQDAAFRETHRASVRNAFGLPANTRILLYAPTWRLASPEVFLSGEQLRDIAAAMGDDVHVLARTHHMGNTRIQPNERVSDATDYPDGQYLCAAADMLITDYSSIAFDFILTGNPALFFIPDYEEYRAKRGLYVDMRAKLVGLTFDSAETLKEECARLGNDRAAADEACAVVRRTFCEAEGPNTCRQVVEDLILPHLASVGTR